MTEIGPAQPAIDPQELLAKLKTPLEGLLREEIASENDPERVYQFRNARRNDMYWRGLQYIYPKLFDGGLIDYSAIGTPMPKSPTEGTGYADYNINIIRGYGRKFTAVLGQRAANMKAVPDDPSDDKSLRTTQMADIAAAILRSQWDVDQRNLDLAMGLYKTGTMFLYTSWVTNGLKYGTTEEPKIEVRTVMSGPPGQEQPMQVPEVVGTSQYENGAVEIAICSLFTVQIPYYIKELRESPYLIYEYEEYRGKLLRAYPQLRDMNLDEGQAEGSGSSAAGLGAMVRDAAASPTALATPKRSNRWNYKRIWITPYIYEAVKEDAVRQLLIEQFAQGVKATYVQGTLVALDAEKLTDYWTECKPEPSEYIFADPVCTDLIPVQDLKNDIGVNIPAETFQRGGPFTFVDPRVIDVPQWDKKQFRPGEIIPAIASAGDNLGSAFFQTQPLQVSPQAQPWIEGLEDDGRTSVGIVPPIFGGQSTAPTAHQGEMEKNAALMQLGMVWLNMRTAWEKAFLNGVRLLSKFGMGTMKHAKQTSTGFQTQVLDFAELQDTGYHFESEEAIPTTWGQKHDTILFLLEKGMEIANITGLTNPMNIPQMNEFLGLTDMYDPMRDQRNKTLKIIQQLLQGAPVQIPAPDGSTQIQPSIPIDDFDEHKLCEQVATAWLIGDSGLAAKAENPDGYANVIAWMQGHKKAGSVPPPPPPPKFSIQEALRDAPPEVVAAVFKDYNLPNAAAAAQNAADQQNAMQAAMAAAPGMPGAPAATPSQPMPGADAQGATAAAPPLGDSGSPSHPPPPTALNPPPGLSIPHQDFPSQ